MTASPKTTISKSKRAAAKTAPTDYAVEQQIGHLLRRAHQRHCGIFADAMPADLTPQQFAALAMVSQLESVSQNELGRRTAMDPATIQGVVKRLMARNLLKSTADPNDRRRHLLTLAPAGKRLMKRLLPAAQEISAQTLAPLTGAERRSLLVLLSKIG